METACNSGCHRMTSPSGNWPQTNDGELKMGIFRFRFAALACVAGLALAATANAQSSTRSIAAPAAPAYSVPAAPAHSAAPATADYGSVIYDSAPQSYGTSYFDAAPASTCTSCQSDRALGSRLSNIGNCGGCGLGSRIGGLRECNLGDQWRLFKPRCDEPRYNIGGWAQIGYAEENNDLFFDNEDNFNLHQLWFYAEKIARPSENGGLGFGWRFDAVFGTDADDTQAFGNTTTPGGRIRGFDNNFATGDDYGWALPQLYGEIAAENWSVKVGHFYTLVGYEVVTAPDNFFFSHAMTQFLSEPFTHTGAIGTFNVSDDLTLYAGWTLGWDTGFDQFADGSSFLGGFSTSVAENSTLTYISTIGDFGFRGSDAYSHSIVVDTQVTDNFNWVVQSDLVRVGSTGEDNVGLNQYFLYSLSDCWGLGSRIEWWKGDTLTGYAPHGGVLPASGSHSYYGATFGVNYKPHANITVRPEYRVDWSPALGYDEGYFAVDLIAAF